jgi:hypothetical protein
VTDRHPDLVGRLGGEVVKPERREQADDSLGDLVAASMREVFSVPEKSREE